MMLVLCIYFIFLCIHIEYMMKMFIYIVRNSRNITICLYINKYDGYKLSCFRMLFTCLKHKKLNLCIKFNLTVQEGKLLRFSHK